MNKIIDFSDDGFGVVRTTTIDGNQWFAAKDVALALGYKNVSAALAQHVEDKNRRYAKFNTRSGRQTLAVINESGLYSLVLFSKLPTANRFKQKILNGAVLPSRNHEKSGTTTEESAFMPDPDLILDLAKKYKSVCDENKQLLAENDLLRGKTRNWDPKCVVIALIRKYASETNKYFGAAFNEFYRELQYGYHIAIGIRAGKAKDKQKRLDYLRDEEMPIAVKVAAAMCKTAGLNLFEIVNDETMSSTQAECVS